MRTRKGQRFCSGACRQAAWVVGGGVRALEKDLRAKGLKPSLPRPVTHSCLICGLVHQARWRPRRPRARPRRRLTLVKGR